MLTARGWWLLFWPGAMTAVALPYLAYWSPTLAVLSLTLLSWFLFEWVWFLVRSRAADGNVTVERHVLHGDRELPNLWAGLDGVVRVRVRLRSRFRLPVRAFACPADGRAAAATQVANGVPVAVTSYLGNGGRNHIQKDGVLYTDSRTRHADITDGLSNTLMIGERPPAGDFRVGWWYRGWGLYEDGTGETVLGVRERNFTSDYRSCPPGPYSFADDKTANPCAVFHFWSLHGGGAHWALCDGSVRFVRYAAADTLTALSTRAGGDVAVLPE